MLWSSVSVALLGLGVVQGLPTKTASQERSPQWWGPPTSSFTPGDPSQPPPCNPEEGNWFCIVPVAPGDMEPDKRADIGIPPDADQGRKDLIARLETELEGLLNNEEETDDDRQKIWELEEVLKALAGVSAISAPPGTVSTFTPGKKTKRQGLFLPPDANSDKKEVIAELEKKLERLQNKQNKTDDDWEEIRALKEALRHIAGVTGVSAPPGTSTTFTPGRRQIVDGNGGEQAAIAELEGQLVALQNKEDKTDDDYAEIAALEAMLAYTEGITSISAPPGSSTSFTIGKR